ncbi:hypothetical protein SK128_011862 [Halocaridina rubra]|uniref:Uncharacterized protein n=1 Tax=Halocaridina rubra TaxID=373956 RepID=A0AAN8WAX3_HALRR
MASEKKHLNPVNMNIVTIMGNLEATKYHTADSKTGPYNDTTSSLRPCIINKSFKVTMNVSHNLPWKTWSTKECTELQIFSTIVVT